MSERNDDANDAPARHTVGRDRNGVAPSTTAAEASSAWSPSPRTAEIVGVPVVDLPRLDIDEDEIEAFLAEIRG